MLTRITHPSGIVTWQSPLLSALGTPHAFSTRVGGISEPPFDFLNLGNPANCDAPDGDANMQENYRRLQAAITDNRPMLRAWCKQVHGVRVIQIEAEPEAEYAESMEAMIADRFHGQIEADALLTNIPNLFLSVRIADCVPILLASDDGQWVAAVHAGWRGVAGNILSRAIRAFAECGINAPRLLAAIGPHISAAHFEVGPEVAEEFKKANLAAAVYHNLGPKPHIDLQAAILLQLAALNVTRVDATDQCTFSNAGDFFSHRREQGHTGRMAALISPILRADAMNEIVARPKSEPLRTI